MLSLKVFLLEGDADALSAAAASDVLRPASTVMRPALTEAQLPRRLWGRGASSSTSSPTPGVGVATCCSSGSVCGDYGRLRARAERDRARYDVLVSTLRLRQAAAELKPQDVATVDGLLVR